MGGRTSCKKRENIMSDKTRGIHLDFHTSPQIPKVGEAFNKKQFQDSLLNGKVQFITLFAKCHHGYCFYPTKIGKMHPNLQFDLLGSQIDAAHEIGVKAAIYIPVGWSNVDMYEHPEWRAYNFDTKKEKNNGFDLSANADEVPPENSWINLCPTGEYLEYLASLTEEICKRYFPADGLFFDICFNDTACVCPRCVESMKKEGLNPENRKDAEKYFTETRIALMQRLNEMIFSYNPNSTVFYNGCTVQNNPVYLQYQTHYEIEILPTVLGEFDVTDFHVRKLESFGKKIYGMTGKFQTCWGEYGSYKNAEALKFECANALSLGIGVIVGDHCHPDGKMDETTYKLIGKSYEYFARLEDICLDTERVADVGVVVAKKNSSNNGVNCYLLESKIDYKIIRTAQDMAGIRLLILPDNAIVSPELKASIQNFLQNGGSVILSGDSVKEMPFTGIDYIGEPKFDVDYVEPCFDVGLGDSPMLFNNAAHIVRAGRPDAKILAKIYEPYFRRTYGHFSGHKNAPNRRTAASYPALLRCENVAYFANEVFAEYEEYGSAYVKRYLDNIFDSLYPERIVKADSLLVQGRVRLRKNREKKYYALHLLYAAQTKRSECFVLNDFPVFKDTQISLFLNETIRKAVLYPQNIPIAVQKNGGRTEIIIPEWRCHQLIVLEF